MTANSKETKNLNNIHRGSIRIYTATFRTLPVEVLHVKAHNLLVYLRENVLRQIFLYKLRRNINYTNALNTLDDREEYKNAENEGTTRSMKVYLRKLE